MDAYSSLTPADPDRLPVETLSRKGITSANSVFMTSGLVRLAFFTQPAEATITQIILPGGSTAAGATPTLARAGFYVIEANGDATLACAIASDTALCSVANTEEVRDLSTGGGLPASYRFRPGQRYAGAAIFVTAAAAPSIRGDNNGISAMMGRAPRLNAAIGGQPDLPATIAAATIAAGNSTGMMLLAGI